MHRQGMSINMWRDGMKIEVKHVKRKQLVSYIPLTVINQGKSVNADKRKSVS